MGLCPKPHEGNKFPFETLFVPIFPEKTIRFCENAKSAPTVQSQVGTDLSVSQGYYSGVFSGKMPACVLFCFLSGADRRKKTE